MRKAVQKSIVSRSQQGYALLTVMFFLSLLVLATIVVAPNVITEVQRQKEEEMIWRGKQYVRGVRLYYAKMHRFPTQLEDLYKPKTGIRFMRQAYKDPMNNTDGSWRLIYVGPNGQLIGSLKNRSVAMNGQATVGFGTPMGSNGNAPFAASSSSSFGSSMTGSSAPAAAGAGQAVQGADNADSSGGTGSLQASNLSDTSNIIGGNIIGVGSKINKKSIIWYDKAKNYRQFEFVWDPSVDSLTGQRAGSVPVTNPNPFGTQGTQPNSNPNSLVPLASGSAGNNPVPTGGSNPGSNSGPTEIPPLQAPPNQ